MRILDKLHLPDEIKKLNHDELNDLVQDLVVEMIEISKKRPIHFSSNLGVIHLTIALLKVFDAKKDDLVFDIGHQTYIYKMLTDRFKQIESIRTSHGLSGFQDPNESEYDKYSAGHAATSLSVATGMALSKIKQDSYTISIIGDGSLSSGLSLEALEVNNVLNAPIIIVINDNNMSIGQNIGSLNQILLQLRTDPTHNNIFVALGYKYFKVDDGHNIDELTKTFQEAKAYVKQTNKSVVVHVITIKGYGYKIDTTGAYHSYYYNHDSNDKIKNSNGYYLAHELIKMHETKKNFIIISPSMTYSTGFSEFKAKYPAYFVDLGIQEENAITISGGIAIKKQLHPIVVTYSTFIQRAYDELLHDVARLNLSITLLLDRADLAVSDGNSHMGIYDVNMLQSIPNTIITSGLTKKQNAQLLQLSLSLNLNKIFCIRYAASAFCTNEELINQIDALPVIYKQWQIIKHNEENKICFISYGTYYLKIIDEFKNIKNVTFINALFLNDYDQNNIEWILQQNFDTIIIYERINQASKLANDLTINVLKTKKQVKIHQLHYDGFINHGTLEEIDSKFKMDINSIKKLFE